MPDEDTKRLMGIFENAAPMLQHQFSAIRGAYGHKGIIGSGGEEVVRRFLTDLLPPQYFTGTGQIVSVQSGLSRQTDVVIADTEHPILFRTQTHQLFFIESVYAVIEVKAKIGAREMRDGIQNIKSYKELPRQFLPAGSLVQKAGNVVVLHEDQTKPTEVHRKRGANPKYGAIFAFGANQDLDQLVDVFAKENASVSPEHRTDAVCVLDKGVILPVSSVTDVIAMAAYSEAHTGWAAFNDSIQALAFFCLHLLMHIMHTQLLRPDISRLLMPALNKANGRAVFPPGINPAGGNV